MTSTLPAILILIVSAGLFALMGRTLVREIRTGIPHLFFSPHPAYRNRKADRSSIFLWFSIATRAFGTLVLSLVTIVAFASLLESLGAISL